MKIKRLFLLTFWLFFLLNSEQKETGIEFGRIITVPISLITISDHNIKKGKPEFNYIPAKINKLKRIDPKQIKDIEEIYLVDKTNIDLNQKSIKTKQLIFSYLSIGNEFISSFKRFINSPKFDKQIIGFKRDGNKISVFAVNKKSKFIEKNVSKSLKKAIIYNRQGQKINISLRTKFVSFSKHRLKKNRLNGVIGLLTHKGQKILENYFEVKSFTVAQATIISQSDDKFGAKGTIGIPVSTIQKQLVNDNGNNLDLIINIDELNSFENGVLPKDGLIINLTPGTVSIMRSLDKLPKKKSNFAISHLLHLINNKEIIDIHKKIWKEQVDSIKNKLKNKQISRDIFNKSLAKMSYFCQLPRYSRYLWSDEGIKIHEAYIPKSISKHFPIGEKILILSHPLLFTLNYAVVEVKGYTKTEAFVLNPELCNLLLRDQDGDILSVVIPKYLPLTKIHIPEKNTISTKRDHQKMALTNNKIIDLIFNDESSNIKTMNTLIDVYVHMLENKRFDLFEKYILTLARYYQACLDRNKKGTNPRYSSKNLDKLAKLIFSKIYKKSIKNENNIYSIPYNQTYKNLKALTKISKNNEFLQQFEKIKSIISTNTNIQCLSEIWQYIDKAIKEE